VQPAAPEAVDAVVKPAVGAGISARLTAYAEKG
jgi:hypothetical protein